MRNCQVGAAGRRSERSARAPRTRFEPRSLRPACEPPRGRVHLGRAARGHCDRGLTDRAVVAGRASGARIGPPGNLYQSPQADRLGLPKSCPGPRRPADRWPGLHVVPNLDRRESSQVHIANLVVGVSNPAILGRKRNLFNPRRQYLCRDYHGHLFLPHPPPPDRLAGGYWASTSCPGLRPTTPAMPAARAKTAMAAECTATAGMA